MKKKLLTLLVFVGSSLALFANGNKESNDEKSTQSTPKIVNAMLQNAGDSMDAQLANDGNSFEVIGNMMDGLFQLDENGHAVPALASDEKISEDGLVHTYTIRSDAFWSNGDPVTAHDFVYGWQREVDPDFGAQHTFMFTVFTPIKNAAEIVSGELPPSALGVKALDDKTFEVTLMNPLSFFDDVLAFPTYYPANQKFVESCGDSYATSADTLLSNGAFIMSNYQPAANSFDLVKNPTYWDADRIQIDGIHYQVLQDSQQALMSYQNGDLDTVYLEGDQIEQVEEDPEFKSFSSGFMWYIEENLNGPKELQNKNFRLALTMAIDRNSIIDNVTKDGSKACYSAVPSELSIDENGNDYTPNLTQFEDVCRYDVDAARAYFEKAKAELGEDTMTLTLICDDATIQQNVAAVLQSQIEKALPGLTIELRVEPKKQRLQDVRSGSFELDLTRWGPAMSDPTNYLNNYISNNSMNTGWNSPEYDEILASTSTGSLVNDPEARMKALKQAERLVMEDAVIVPLYEKHNAVLVKSNIKNLQFHPVALNRVFKDVVID